MNKLDNKMDDIFSDIDVLPLDQLQQLRLQVCKYIKLIDEKITIIELPIKEEEHRKAGINYLEDWFSGVSPEVRNYPMLMEWFLKYASPERFELHFCYYVGKHSVHVNVIYTLWLVENRDLQYHSIDGSGWWKHPKGNFESLKTALQPPKSDKLIQMFENINPDEFDEEFMENLTAYIHSKTFREARRWNTDEQYIFDDGYEDDY